MGLAAPAGIVEHRLPMHLSSGSTPARPHSLTSVFTQSDHVFLGFHFPLMPGMDLIQDVAPYTWPYHLGCRQRRANGMQYPQCQVSVVVELRVFRLCRWFHRPNKRIMARSLRRSRCSLGLFAPHVSLPWGIAQQTRGPVSISEETPFRKIS